MKALPSKYTMSYALAQTCKRRKRDEAPFISDCMSGAKETSFSKSRINRICRQGNRKHAYVHRAMGICRRQLQLQASCCAGATCCTIGL